MKKIYNARGEYKKLNTAFIAVFICLVAILNISVYALAQRYEWYLYRAEEYTHTIGSASDRLFSEEEQKEVEIIFCMEEDELTSDVVYDLVWQTAKQLQEKHDFISVDAVNLYLQPARLSKYKYTTLEDGSQIRNTINSSSVIFVCGDQFRVETFSSFFNLDAQSRINSYNGEEYMLSCIKWVQTDYHPIAYFTNTHGESFSGMLGFYNVLTACGYEVRTIDLSAEKLSDRAGIVIIANPIYDIERAAEGYGITSEADVLEDFLSGGGVLFVSIDPYVKSPLTQLRAFLSEWGMNTSGEIISDSENSITHDGYTLVAKYSSSELGSEIGALVRSYNQSQTILKDASPIRIEEKDGVKTSEIISSYPSAHSYYNGELRSEEGDFTLLAVAERDEGKVILSSGAYLLANDVLNSSVYSNRELVLALLEKSGAPYAVIGTHTLPVGETLLQGLTTSATRIYSLVFVVVIPLLLALAGVAYLVRRRNR